MQFVGQIKSQVKIENPTNYLYGIAYKVYLKFLREKYRNIFVQLNENLTGCIPEFNAAIEKQTPEELLLKVLPELPPKQQLIIKLRLIDKLNLQQICEKTKRSMNYVKTMQKRGIKNLKEILSRTPVSTLITDEQATTN